MNRKLVVILGQTASGKSALAVKIAKKFKGEVVSADSRQVYRGMDIGTGKITIKETKGIPHHLLNITSPKKRFTVAQYKKLAIEAINKIQRKGKLPILCGGTGLYIQAVVDGITIPEVKPNWPLRRILDKLNTEELFEKLKKLDPKRTETIDKHNRRRLIRAIEIVLKTKKPIPGLKKIPLPYPVLMLGIKKGKEELEKLIEKRFLKWLEEGFLKEVLNLRKMGLSWKRIEEFGINYRTASQYLKKVITEEEFIKKSLIELRNYAKRQITWFKRDGRINWIKTYKEAERLIKRFI